MKAPLSPAHGTGLGTTTGITSVITLVAAVSLLGQCGHLAPLEAALAASSLGCFVLGAGGLYLARNWVGLALDQAAVDPKAAAVAAARSLTRFHLGMAGVFAGCAFATAFRLGLPYGRLAWLAPLAAGGLAVRAVLNGVDWVREARRRADTGDPAGARNV